MKKVLRHPIFFGATSLSLVAGLLYGCQDFLSKAAAPEGVLNEQTLSNSAGVEGSLIATYRALDCTDATSANWGCAASNWVWGSVTSDDAYKGSEASDQPPINDIEGYHWSTGDAESYLNTKWRAVYEGIVRSNATLRLLKQVTATPGAISSTDADGIKGEATFLRAHYHFEAWRVWGKVPYYREDDTDPRKANDLTVAQVGDEILKDLDTAIKYLPPTARGGASGRVTQWTAKAYKGRVLMYLGGAANFAAAQTLFRQVKASNVYALEASYDRVWTGFVTNGKETILAYQASANDGEPNGNNANWGERLNLPHGGSHAGCCGFHQPSQNLVNFFQVDGAGLPLSISNAGGWNVVNDTLNRVAGSTATFDPRLDWTVGRDGVPYKDWGTHEYSWIRQSSYGGFYSPKKNAHEVASKTESNVGWVNTQLNAVNIHIFRYADMLLMLAEADVEVNGAGDIAEAMQIVNDIRTRAGVKVQGCAVPTDATLSKEATALVTKYPQCAGDTRIAVDRTDPANHVTWAKYNIGLYPAVLPPVQAREAVRTERRLELAMEGQRFFDLKRWGIAHSVINDYLSGGPTSGGGAEKNRRNYLTGAEPWSGANDRHYFFPIPAIQIELSKVGGAERLVQNTGW